ncbi:hypothetical protein [Cryptosporangium minutisporangium]|uniref:Integral membrane protein n=1 Tax=Cryptosporangium minutisporangium TaxID=113569 RepID=A0ABP6T372_9ACTN
MTIATPIATDRLLRLALRIDGVASGALGVGLLALAGVAEDRLGASTALTVSVGIFLVLFGAALVLLAARPRIPPAAVWVIIIGNLGWVAESVILAVSDDLTGLGVALTLAQAAAVLVFADLEYAGLRRAMRR